MTVLELATTLLAQAGDTAADAVDADVPQTMWDFIKKGGIVMYPIALTSLVGVTVIAERMIVLRRRRVIPPRFLPGLARILDDPAKGRDEALKYCRTDGSPIASVVAAGLKRLGGPVEIVERQIEEAGERIVLQLRARLRVLSVVAAVAPLLGLLGTILGMISAFRTVSMSGEALGRTELLAAGIYEAMITTAAGLIVAIPTVVRYHWLAARVQRLVMEIDRITVDFIDERASAHAKPPAARVTAVAPSGPPPLPLGDGHAAPRAAPSRGVAGRTP